PRRPPPRTTDVAQRPRAPRRAPSKGRITRLVMATELRSFLRDRRALLSAIVLPVVLYPLLFFANTWLEQVGRETLAAREVTLGLDLSSADAELAELVRRRLEDEPPIALVDVDATRLRELSDALHEGRPEAVEEERRLARALLDEGHDAVVICVPHSVLAGRIAFRVHYDGSDDLSNEAQDRAERALDDLAEREARRRRERVLGAHDPGRGLDAERVDVATASDTSGAALGKLLPLVAVLVLLSGGAYGALSAFAGEREANTLETLLVQPVPADAVVRGKFAAVLLLAIAALASNALSLVGSVIGGLGRLPGMDATDARGLSLAVLAPELANLGLGALLFLPAAVLLCAVLCFVSARARSFREGQQAIFPLTLVAALPAGVVAGADIDLSWGTALVPLLGNALCLRDAIGGQFAAGPAALAFGAGMGWAALVLRRMAGLLDAERILQGDANEREQDQRRTQSTRALGWGFAAALAIYAVGGWLQSRSAVWGLLATLWLLAPGIAWLSARGTARRARTGLAEVLALRAPRLAHLAGAVCLAPALVWLMRQWVPFQQRVLPMPSTHLAADSPFAALLDQPQWLLFAALALSPAIGEELLFRGALQSGLRRDLGAGRTAAWQALLFGLAHASLWRFVPTAVLGGVLSLVTSRARSVFPAMALHMAYNAMLVLGEDHPWTQDVRWLGLLPVGLLLLWVRPGARRDLIPRGAA
ncbi:MAG TPA: CPBP family glutamic-type intramembrane protease, partial [Planctomycetota bacterium]|nr:CPBP family glutamic-type intramembrane protease [Planctomycetota bacterium]